MSSHPWRAWGVAAECSLHQRRRVELGFHGFHQVFSGVLGATQARLFSFNFADLAVNLVARGYGKGVEEFLEAFGLAEFAGEDGVDGHEGRGTYHGCEGLSGFSRINRNGGCVLMDSW
jgi:hypothetical protein